MKFQRFDGTAAIGEAIAMVCGGDLDAALVKKALPNEHCKTLATRFQHSRDRRDRRDNVPGYILGSTHYGKTPADYFRACSFERDALDAVFKIGIDPLMSAFRALAEHTQRTVRPSRFAGQEASHARIVEWANDDSRGNGLLLQPHEDISQVDCDRNTGWEIQKVAEVVAVNFYADAKAGEGRLRLYDFAPDSAQRAELGLDGLGYPYPLKLLDNKSFVDMAVNVGDLAVFRGNLVHSVTASKARRIVVNGFLAQLKNEYVYWT